MKLTNKYNLPEQVVKLLSKEYYDGSGADYSVTELIDSPRRVQLLRRHRDELEEDVVDRYFSFLGNMAHSIMEAASLDIPGHRTEERFFCNIGVGLEARVISGKLDHHHDGIIRDYKYTSVWSYIYQGQLKKWTEQLNLYSYLLKHNKIKVEELEIICILRDWNQNKVQEQGYPRSPIVVVPIEMWPDYMACTFISDRVGKHRDNEGKVNELLDPCTLEEMWEKPPTWAVMKPGNKRATKVFSNKAEAEDWLNFTTEKFNLVERPGERTRCTKYCSVNRWCNQYNNGGTA